MESHFELAEKVMFKATARVRGKTYGTLPHLLRKVRQRAGPWWSQYSDPSKHGRVARGGGPSAPLSNNPKRAPSFPQFVEGGIYIVVKCDVL